MSGPDAFSLRPVFPLVPNQSLLPSSWNFSARPGNGTTRATENFINPPANLADPDECSGCTKFAINAVSASRSVNLWRRRQEETRQMSHEALRVGAFFRLAAAVLLGVGGASPAWAQSLPPAQP